MAIEGCTSIARKSGYSIKNPAAGFVFQNSLSLLSRVMVFVFMPLLGYLADTNSLAVTMSHLIILFLPTPILLCVIYFFRFKVETLVTILLYRINTHGSFFKKVNHEFTIKRNKKYILTKFKSLYGSFVLAYIPFYLAWPVTVLLITEFNDYRATIIGLSSIFNGLNTIYITLFLDPKLTQLGNYPNIINSLYSDLLILRVLSAAIALAFIPLLMIFI